jgi:hypothetical protein
MMRDWMALPKERDSERRRAFHLMQVAANAMEDIRSTASENPESLGAVFKLADSLAEDLYFASGAFCQNGGEPRDPAIGFAEEAFDLLAMLTEFKHPSIVHRIVETLARIAPADPRRAFLIVHATVKAGDAYTRDSLAADMTISLIERYLAEFRNIVVADPELLTATRSILDAFVRVGWPAAVSLSYRLGDAFR